MRLAFYKGRRGGFAGAFDAAVRWWTRGPYSHVELVFADGIAASRSTRDHGVRFKRTELHPDRWDFVEIGDNEAGLWWVITGRGQEPDPDEPFSSRVGRNAIAGKRWALIAEKIVDGIFGAGHCRESALDPTD